MSVYRPEGAGGPVTSLPSLGQVLAVYHLAVYHLAVAEPADDGADHGGGYHVRRVGRSEGDDQRRAAAVRVADPGHMGRAERAPGPPFHAAVVRLSDCRGRYSLYRWTALVCLT